MLRLVVSVVVALVVRVDVCDVVRVVVLDDVRELVGEVVRDVVREVVGVVISHEANSPPMKSFTALLSVCTVSSHCVLSHARRLGK